jgi:hypothetical protein
MPAFAEACPTRRFTPAGVARRLCETSGVRVYVRVIKREIAARQPGPRDRLAPLRAAEADSGVGIRGFERVP